MDHLWQELAVALLVIASALYAPWRLMPMQRRRALIERLLPGTVARGWKARVRQAMAKDAARGCAGCAESSAPAAGQGRRGPGTGHE